MARDLQCCDSQEATANLVHIAQQTAGPYSAWKETMPTTQLSAASPSILGLRRISLLATSRPLVHLQLLVRTESGRLTEGRNGRERIPQTKLVPCVALTSSLRREWISAPDIPLLFHISFANQLTGSVDVAFLFWHESPSLYIKYYYVLSDTRTST